VTTDALGRTINEPLTIDQLKSLIESDVKPIFNSAEKERKANNDTLAYVDKNIKKIINFLKKLSKDKTDKLAERFFGSKPNDDLKQAVALLKNISDSIKNNTPQTPVAGNERFDKFLEKMIGKNSVSNNNNVGNFRRSWIDQSYGGPQYAYKTTLNALTRNIDQLTNALLGFNPISLFSEGLIAEEVKYRKDLYEVLFIQEGIVKTNKEIQKQYEMTGGTLLDNERKWQSIAKITGQTIGKNIDVYVKALSAGVKDQKTAEKIMKTSGSLATAIGVDVTETGEMLNNWTLQLGLSNNQSAQMSRNVQEIGRQTGLTGVNLTRAVKASDNLLKSLRNAATLSAETARNFALAKAVGEKTGVGDEVDSILKALVSGTDFLSNADEGIKNILAVATGRSFGPGLFQDILFGKGGNRENINKIGQSFKELVIDLTKEVGGVRIKSLDELAALPANVRFQVDNALSQLSRGKVRIGNIGLIADALTKAGQSFSSQIAELDRTIFSSIATEQEKILAKQQKEQAILTENFRIQTSIAESLKNSGGGNLANSIEAAIQRLSSDIPNFQGQLRSMGVVASTGIDVVRQSLENTFDSLSTQLTRLGKESSLKLKKEDISAALADQTGKKYRQLLADLNEASQLLTTSQRASTDPITQLTKEIKELNASIRGLTGKGLFDFINRIEKSGLLLITFSAGLGTLIAKVELFEIFARNLLDAIGFGFRLFSGSLGRTTEKIDLFNKVIKNVSLSLNPLDIGTRLGVVLGLFGSMATQLFNIVASTKTFKTTLDAITSTIKFINSTWLNIFKGLSSFAVLTVKNLIASTELIVKGFMGMSNFAIKFTEMLAKAVGVLDKSATGVLAAKIGDWFNYLIKSFSSLSKIGVWFSELAKTFPSLSKIGSLFVYLGNVLSRAMPELISLFNKGGIFRLFLNQIFDGIKLVEKITSPIQTVFVKIFSTTFNALTKFGTVLGRILGPISLVTGAFIGLTKQNNAFTKSQNLLFGILTGDTGIGVGESGEAAGIGKAALQGSTVGGFIGAFFGPVGSVVGAALGGIVGAITEMYKIVKLGGALKNSILTAWASVQEAWLELKTGFINLGKELMKSLKFIWKDIQEVFGGKNINWGETIVQMGLFLKQISQFIRSIVEFTGSGLAKSLEVLWVVGKPIFEGVVDFFRGIGQAYQGFKSNNQEEIFEGIKKIIKGAINVAVAATVGYIVGLPGLIIPFIGEMAQKIGKEIGGSFGEVLSGIGAALASIKQILDGVIKTVTGIFTFNPELISQGFSKIWDGFLIIVKNIGKAIKETFFNLPGELLGLIRKFDWNQLGKDVGSYVVNAIRDFNLTEFFQKYWKEILIGIAVAINPAAIVALVLTPLLSALLQGISEAVAGFFEGMAEKLKDSFPNLSQFLGSVSQLFRRTSDIFGGLLQAIQALFQGNWEEMFNGIAKSIGAFLRLAIEDYIKIMWDASIGLFAKLISKLGGDSEFAKAMKKVIDMIGDLPFFLLNALAVAIRKLPGGDSIVNKLFGTAYGTSFNLEVIRAEEKKVRAEEELARRTSAATDEFIKSMQKSTASMTYQGKSAAEMFTNIRTENDANRVLDNLITPFNRTINASVNQLKDLGYTKVFDLARFKKRDFDIEIERLQSRGNNSNKERQIIDILKIIQSANENIENLETVKRNAIRQRVTPFSIATANIEERVKAGLGSENESLIQAINAFMANSPFNRTESVTKLTELITKSSRRSIEDRSTLRILSSSLTWEEKQAQLLAEGNQLQRQAIALQDDPVRFAQMVAKAAETQLAIAQAREQQRLSQLARGDISVGPRQVDAGLAELLRTRNANTDSIAYQQITNNIQDDLRRIGVNLAAVNNGTEIFRSLTGTLNDRATQAVNIWRSAQTTTELLASSEAQAILAYSDRAQRTAIANRRYTELIKELEQTLVRRSSATGAAIEATNKKIANIASDAAATLVARDFQGGNASSLIGGNRIRQILELNQSALHPEAFSQLAKIKEFSRAYDLKGSPLPKEAIRELIIETFKNIEKQIAEAKTPAEVARLASMQAGVFLAGNELILGKKTKPTETDIAEILGINRLDLFNSEARKMAIATRLQNFNPQTTETLFNPRTALPPRAKTTEELIAELASRGVISPTILRARELANRSGIPFSERVGAGQYDAGANRIDSLVNIPYRINNRQINPSLLTTDELQRLIEAGSAVERRRGNPGFSIPEFQAELNKRTIEIETGVRRGNLDVVNLLSQILKAIKDEAEEGGWENGLDAIQKAFNQTIFGKMIIPFIRAGMTEGSIYVHDVDLENKLEPIAKAIPVIQSRLDTDAKLRLNRAIEIAEGQGEIDDSINKVADNTDETVKELRNMIKLLIEQNKLLKETLASDPGAGVSGGIRTEPSWNPATDNSYAYTYESTVTWGAS
jgi:hypothetical protein